MLPELTAEELASFQAYAAHIEAEDARRIAEGLPVFSAILDRLRDDESAFAAGLGDGYLAFYDRRGPRPEMTASAVYAYLSQDTGEPESAEHHAGFIAGWFVALAENEPSFYWQSSPPPECQAH